MWFLQSENCIFVLRNSSLNIYLCVQTETQWNLAYLLNFCMFEIPDSVKFCAENIFFLWGSANVIQWGANKWQGTLNFSHSFVKLKWDFLLTIDIEYYFWFYEWGINSCRLSSQKYGALIRVRSTTKSINHCEANEVLRGQWIEWFKTITVHSPQVTKMTKLLVVPGIGEQLICVQKFEPKYSPLCSNRNSVETNSGGNHAYLLNFECSKFRTR